MSAENVTDVTPKKERWRGVFLDALRQSPNVSAAAAAAGKNRMFVYRERAKSPTFAKAWKDALAESMDVAEGEAYRRAVQGVEKPVFGSLGTGMGSGRIGEVQEYSDTLLIFLLKAHKPKKYRENSRIEHTGKDGSPIQIQAFEYGHAIAPLAARPIADSDAPGKGEGDRDGEALGQEPDGR